MIIATGIDAVEVARFKNWHTKQFNSLQRIFSDAEVAYCLSNSVLSAQRFAVRFAAKEAAYKAAQNIPELQNIPFLTLIRAITIAKQPSGAPNLIIDWHLLGITIPYTIVWHVSLTHTNTIAIASVIAETAIKSQLSFD